MFRSTTAASLILLSCAAVSAQDRIETFATGANPYLDAKISPNGANVAFRGVSSIGSIGVSNGFERTLATQSGQITLGDFIWAPDSSGLFFAALNGGSNVATVSFVSRNGGSPIVLGSVSDTGSMSLGSASSTHVYGSRFDFAAQTYHVFRVPRGGGGIEDVLSSADVLADVRVDPSNSYLLVRTAGTFPFAPVSYLRIDVDGSNQIGVVGAPVGVFAEKSNWLDNGDTIVYDGVDPVNGGLQVLRVDRSAQQIEPMTALATHRRVSVAPFRDYLVFESIDGNGGNSPAILPWDGGALMQLGFGRQYVYTGTPTMDEGRNLVVFSAEDPGLGGPSKIFLARVSDLMVVSPRAELNAVVNWDLPIPNGQLGAVLIAGGALAVPLVIQNVDYEFHLDASFSFLSAGASINGSVQASLPIPPISILQGLDIYTQGIRIDDNGGSAGFGRRGFFRIQ